jgi:hypothetical protein
MLVRVLKKHVPRVGKKGDKVEVPDRAARVLITIGSVEQVAAEPEKPAKAPRTYVRRDMKAEDDESPRERRNA